MNSGPLNPKEVAQAAIARGDLHTHEGQAHNCPICGVEASMGKIFRLIKFPAEVGLDAIVPPPPRPRRKYKKTIPQKSKYIITPKKLLEMGFTRQELQHIKNEVRSQ